MADDVDKIIQAALDDLQDRVTAEGLAAVAVWFSHWKSQYPQWHGIFRSAANNMRVGILITPPGHNQQINIHGSNNVVQGDSANIQVSQSINPVAGVESPKTRIARDIVPYIAGLTAATIATAWVVPVPHKWRIGITVVTCTAILAFAVTAWLQARMRVWEKRIYFGFAAMLLAEMVVRRFISGWSASAGKSENEVWLKIIAEGTDPPIVTIAKLTAIVTLVFFAFRTPQSD